MGRSKSHCLRQDRGRRVQRQVVVLEWTSDTMGWKLTAAVLFPKQAHHNLTHTAREITRERESYPAFFKIINVIKN